MSGQEMYSMGLNETLTIPGWNKPDHLTMVRKVPGGWIYSFIATKHSNSVFVPYNFFRYLKNLMTKWRWKNEKDTHKTT